ncbi:MAG: hypothetical protein GX180_14475 [Enterococcus sp.]|nr:hypothetical protein [Enterococcus sp.]
MSKIRTAILRNESDESKLKWIYSCEKYRDEIDCSIIDITKQDWLDQVLSVNPDILLTIPGGLTAPFKQLYDERLTILVKELGFMAFPTLDEVLIYENKRYLAYWLAANKIPHPGTYVFYYKNEAFDFLKRAKYPLIGKVNIGASGSGVTILKNNDQAIKYVNSTFSGSGAFKRTGPNFQKKYILGRGFQYILHPSRIDKKLAIYKARSSDIQKDFVLLQEFVPHDFEWRVIRMGDSFFAHKKVKIGEKASGSLIKRYDNPPVKIFDFVKNLTDRFGFYTIAIDIFESDECYLVNEMQCIFGQSDSYQMLVDSKPGRYLNKHEGWYFEEGDYNTNESFDLRLQTAIDLFKNNNT